MVEPDVPSAVDQGCLFKLKIFWEAERGLAVTILTILILLILGGIFLIIYFTVIKPHSDSA